LLDASYENHSVNPELTNYWLDRP